MTHLLEKNTPFIFSNECIQAFETLKKKLNEAPIFIALDWDLPFELMCDASDFAIGCKHYFWDDPYFQNIVADQILRGVLRAKKLLTSSQLAIVDPQLAIVDPPDVTLVSVKEKFRNVMKCLKIPSKFAKSLTGCWACDYIGTFPSSRGNNTYSLAVDYLLNGFEAKARPTNDAELFANFLNISSDDFVPLVHHK
ncbi:reverse transcriptase domain-containing protein [Tanacetum coccineum]